MSTLQTSTDTRVSAREDAGYERRKREGVHGVAAAAGTEGGKVMLTPIQPVKVSKGQACARKREILDGNPLPCGCCGPQYDGN